MKVKQILKKYGNTFVLHPLNPKYQDMEVKKGEFQIIGRVGDTEIRYSRIKDED